MSVYNDKRLKLQFLDYFKSKGHTIVKSSSVVPYNDPSLLFTNSGMVQFKNILMGHDTSYTRACSIQRCIRAGGKHNDLDDVGKDVYHHTYFEMLGNWSFGDYTKEQAITYAWDLLINVLHLDKSRIYVTYYKDMDTESYDIWKNKLPSNHIIQACKKDNFWEMGDTGPCGPCTEIHYDRIGNRDASHLVNKDDPNVLEIWNIVFIEYNRTLKGLEPLTRKCIDTGIGFERLLSILNNVSSNYLTPVFTPLITKIQHMTGLSYEDGFTQTDIAFRTVADHCRTTAVCLHDNVEFSNDKQGYVLRRILRRCIRYAHDILGLKKGDISVLIRDQLYVLYDEDKMYEDIDKWIDTLSVSVSGGGSGTTMKDTVKDTMKDTVKDTMKDTMKDTNTTNLLDMNGTVDTTTSNTDTCNTTTRNTTTSNNIHSTIQKLIDLVDKEETLFLLTLKKGVDRFNKLCAHTNVITSQEIFKLHDTYGFPTDLVQILADEKNVQLDFSKYDELKEKAKNISKKVKGRVTELILKDIPYTHDEYKYTHHEMYAHLLLYIIDRDITRVYEECMLSSSVSDGSVVEDNVVGDNVVGDSVVGDSVVGDNVVGHSKDKIHDNTSNNSIIHDNTSNNSTIHDNTSNNNNNIHDNTEIGLVFDKTCFYGECGGQVGDTGVITCYDNDMVVGHIIVHDTQIVSKYVVHYGTLQGKLSKKCMLRYYDRTGIQRNHTGTHLLNYVLRKQIQTQQRGSYVCNDKLRLDYDNGKVDIQEVERSVNEIINRRQEVHVSHIKKEDILNETSLIYMKNEEYPDIVRMISVKDTDIKELCGGTHTHNTGDLYKLRIISDSSVSSNVRRIVAITGDEVIKAEEKVRVLEECIRNKETVHIDKDIPLCDRIRLEEQVRRNNEHIKMINKENCTKNRNRLRECIIKNEMDSKKDKKDSTTCEDKKGSTTCEDKKDSTTCNCKKDSMNGCTTEKDITTTKNTSTTKNSTTTNHTSTTKNTSTTTGNTIQLFEYHRNQYETKKDLWKNINSLRTIVDTLYVIWFVYDDMVHGYCKDSSNRIKDILTRHGTDMTLRHEQDDVYKFTCKGVHDLHSVLAGIQGTNKQV